LPYQNKSAETKDIIAEWSAHHADSDPPGASTIRKHLPNPGS
jgi:hypothetical protein